MATKAARAIDSAPIEHWPEVLAELFGSIAQRFRRVEVRSGEPASSGEARRATCGKEAVRRCAPVGDGCAVTNPSGRFERRGR